MSKLFRIFPESLPKKADDYIIEVQTAIKAVHGE